KFNTQDSGNNYVVMSILQGQVDLTIAEGFDASGGKFEILWRGGYALTVTKGEYTIETAFESELRVLAITVKRGEGSLAGPDYEIPVISEGSSISIAGNANLTFLRLRCFAGSIGVTVLDEALHPRVIEMNEGRVVKILRKLSATADAVIATVMEIDENNNIVRADTYTMSRDDSAKVRVLREALFLKEVDGKNGGGIPVVTDPNHPNDPPLEPNPVISRVDPKPEAPENPKGPDEPFENPIPDILMLNPTLLDTTPPHPVKEKPRAFNPVTFTFVGNQ
ncbi:MAG: hypothetical protein O3C57_02340, partial [Verrucomicrobia bacterium]|nr:hypothetical protein [Verrucomicrobiota bacterium]